MKIIILSLLFLFAVNAQDGVTRFFIDFDTPAGTSGDGESWATAWKYTGAGSPQAGCIDWSVITDGDTIYFSGGTDTTYYYPRFEGQPHYFNQNGTEYTYATQVILCPSWEAGHNGSVFLVDTSTQSTQGIVTFGGYLNNVKLYGVTIQDLRPQGSNSLSMFLMYGTDIVFESDTILTGGMGGGGGFGGFRNILRNCVYIEPANETTTASDFMGQFEGKGAGIIEGCKIFIENNYTMISGDGTGVTITDTSLTDTDLTGGDAMTTDYHVGITLICGGRTATVTSNTSNTFYFSGGWDGATPSNGTAWSMEGVHRDIIQYSTQTTEIGENFESIIRNNLIVDQGTRGTGWNSMMYTSSPAVDARFLFYNNIFVNREEISSGGVFLYESRDLPFGNTTGTGVTVTDTSLTDVALSMTTNSMVNKIVYCGSSRASVTSNNATTLFFSDGWSIAGLPSFGFVSGSTPANGLPYRDIKTSIRFFNNTMITKGDASINPADSLYDSTIPINLGQIDTLYFKNNIVIVDTMHKTFINNNGNDITAWDYNIYASDGYNLESFAYDGPVRTWDQWVAQGHDANSDTTYADNVTFVNKYGREITDYYTTTGRDLGDDLTDMPDYAGILSRHPDIIKDILGRTRVAPFDIGALEYQTPSGIIRKKSRVIIVQ